MLARQSQMPLLVSVRVLRVERMPSCSYEKYERMLTNRAARDRYKELTLSHHHVSDPKENGKPSDGTFLFHLPFSVRVRSDGTLPPIYLHSAKRMTRLPPIYMYGVSPTEVRIYAIQHFHPLLFSTLPLLSYRINLDIGVLSADSSQGLWPLFLSFPFRS